MAGVIVVSPDGEVGEIPEENAEQAYQAGFRPETRQEGYERGRKAKYGDRDVEAFAAGVGRGATFGLTDLALSKSGLVESETLKGLQTHNEGASIAGDVVGAAGTMLIPGVGGFTAGGLAAKAGAAGAKVAGKALGKGLASRVAAKGIGGAVEGGLFGLGSAISEDVLEDGNLDLAGEKLASHIGIGVILGGGANALVEGASGGIAKLLKRGAVNDDIKRVLSETSDEAGEIVLDNQQSKTILDQPAAGKKFKIGVDIEDLPDDEAIAGTVAEHAPRIKAVFERVGLEFPTPENLVLRDLDVQRNSLHKLKKKGVDQFAAQQLLEDPRYANAKEYGEKLAIIRDRQAKAAGEIDSTVSRFDEVAEASELFDPTVSAQRIEEEVLAPLRKGTAQNKPIIDRLEQEIEQIKNMAAGDGYSVSLKDAEAYKRSLDAHINWNQTDSNEIKAAAKAMRQVRGILNNDIEKRVQAIAERIDDAGAFDAWKKAKKVYGSMAELGGIADKRQAAKEANRYFSLTDYLAGGSALSAFSGDNTDPGDLAFAGIAALGNKWARERLAHVMAVQLNRVARSGVQQTAAKGFLKTFKKLEKEATESAATMPIMPTAPSVAPMAGPATVSMRAAVPQAAAKVAKATEAFGQYLPILSAAAESGHETLFATHAALSQTDPAYRAQMEAAGYKQEDETASRHGSRMAAQYAAIQAVAEQHDADMNEAVTGFLDGKSVTPSGKQMPTKDHKRRLTELAELAADPQALIDRLQNSSISSAPGVSMAVASTVSRAAAFLHEKAPKDPNPPALPGLERDWTPSGMELAKWQRYVMAVESPKAVIEEMQKGTITREAVDALKAVYPQLLGDMQRKTILELGNKKRALSYKQKLALAVLLGDQVDPTMSKASMSQIQGVHAANAQPQQQGPSGQRVKFPSSQTQADRIAKR